jgi:2-hydroxy-3-keto-5-methylthiopentenyl-1-phosphate phosphatase
MTETMIRHYLFASDFDQTLSFDDSGLVLTELLGIPAEEFKHKIDGMAQMNLVQQGAELAYLLLHDPAFRSRVRREHLVEAGKRIPLKQNIDLLYRTLREGIPGYEFDFFVLSAAPVEIVQSALEGIVPADHIYGTEFQWGPHGEIERLIRCTAGWGKVTRILQLQTERELGPDRIVYSGDGSSDMHAILHVNEGDGLTIAVSETRSLTRIARRTVLSENALSVLVPILEEVADWTQPQIRGFFESHGFLVQDWARMRTDVLTLRAAAATSTPTQPATGAETD